MVIYMKEVVRIVSKGKELTSRELITAALLHILCFFSGLIFTKAIVFQKLLPFGISFLSGCPLTYTPSVALGVFIGYFIPAIGNGGFKYIAALFAVLAIKLLLSNYKRIITNPLFLTFIAFIASLLTSAIALKGMEISLVEFITEALLTGVATYFVAQSAKALEKDCIVFSIDELAGVLIVLGILLMGLHNLEITGISLGRILGVLLILCAGKYGGIISSSISGITVAITLSLSGNSGNIGVALAFAGLMVGVFSSMGKYAQVVTIIIFGFIGTVGEGDITLISRTLIETMLGSALFLTLPRKWGIVLSRVLSSQPKLAIPESFKKSLTLRLELASNALKDVSQTVEQVSVELSKINSPDFNGVLSAIEQDACAGCKLRLHCWETKKDRTIEAVMEMTKAVKQGECSPENAAPDEFKVRCLRSTRVGNAAYRRYTEYASRIAAENRINEVRSVVSDQFDGISEMLYDLALDFKGDQHFDNTAADKAAQVLKNFNINVSEACGRIDKYGRMTLEFKVKKSTDTVVNKLQIMKALSVACERDFDIPNVSQVGNDIFIVLNESPALTIDFGAEQICSNGSNICGDAYKYFNDGRGHFIMILSDGMGTGGRAAVDGAMASGLMARLIKAGFGYDCSLKILNSSMLFKSTDESLATVDIASIDLFSGQTELYKAGAAPTIVRRSGKTGKAASTSLPAGILRDIGFDRAIIKCKNQDIIVLMSDGVTSSGTDWIRTEIESWQDGTAQELAEKLCEYAKRRRSGAHQDDITVLTAILNKAV